MTIDSQQVSGFSPTGPSRSLADRVKARVLEAEHELEERGRGAATKPRPRRSGRSAGASLTEHSGAAQDTKSLRSVYYELRATYRRHRRQAGLPALPELRDAVRAFKRGQSLTSLTAIATFLDERKLLAW